MKATITSLIPDRDCGVITITDTNETFYFHYSLCDSLDEIVKGKEVIVTLRAGRYCNIVSKVA